MEHDLSLDSVEKKRFHVTNACLNCKKLHVSCDSERPCNRCVERNKECCYGESKKRGRKKQVELHPSPNSPPNPSPPPAVSQNMGLMETEVDPPGLDVGSEPFELDFLEDLFLSKPFENVEPPVQKIEKNETPSTFSRADSCVKLHEILIRKLPDKAALIDANALPMHNQLVAIREGLNPEAVMEIMRSFETYITNFGGLFNELGTPSLIWERSGIIHYMNQAYLDLTGFNSPIPTPVDDFAFIEALSNEGLGKYVDCLTQLFLSGRPAALVDTFTFSTGIKAAGSGWIQGTMCFTVKRDLLGLPLVFVGNFLPAAP